MHRRDFLAAGVSAGSWLLAKTTLAQDQERPKVMTVTGEASADELGVMLPHEHVLVDFIGAEQVRPDRYKRDEVVEVMTPYLNRVRELGCRALAECTPAYLARDPVVLRRLSETTGVRLLTNTGYYGARQGKYLPAHAHTDSADELAARWRREWQEGIHGTGIRPGFIKIGLDGGPLNAMNRKLVQAAARCHRQTGLTIAAHTGDGQAALEQAEELEKEGVSLAAWIWVHAQNEKNAELHQQLARRGAWVEFDGVGPASIPRHVELVTKMKRAGLLDRVLISQDAGWYSVSEPRGGTIRPFDTLFTDFLPALRQAGVTDDEIRQLTVTNPAAAFTLGVRAV